VSEKSLKRPAGPELQKGESRSAPLRRSKRLSAEAHYLFRKVKDENRGPREATEEGEGMKVRSSLDRGDGWFGVKMLVLAKGRRSALEFGRRHGERGAGGRYPHQL